MLFHCIIRFLRVRLIFCLLVFFFFAAGWKPAYTVGNGYLILYLLISFFLHYLIFLSSLSYLLISIILLSYLYSLLIGLRACAWCAAGNAREQKKLCYKKRPFFVTYFSFVIKQRQKSPTHKAWEKEKRRHDYTKIKAKVHKNYKKCEKNLQERNFCIIFASEIET